MGCIALDGYVEDGAGSKVRIENPGSRREPITRPFLRYMSGSPSLGRPKEGARKVAAAAGLALSLCKGYAAQVKHSVEFLTPAAAPTTLRDSGPVNQHSEAW
jgi:hypothetical protein